MARILLAEDDEQVSAPIIQDFQDAGYRVEVVENGPAVIEKAAVLKPSIILMKNMLPRMNGTVCAPLLKQMPGSSRVPIIVYDTTRSPGSAGMAPSGVDVFMTTANPRTLLRTANEACR